MSNTRKTRELQEVAESELLYSYVFSLLSQGEKRDQFEKEIDAVVERHRVFKHEDSVEPVKEKKVSADTLPASSYNAEMRKLLQKEEKKPIEVKSDVVPAKEKAREFYLGPAVYKLYQLIGAAIKVEQKEPGSEAHKAAIALAQNESLRIVKDRHQKKTAFMAEYEQNIQESVTQPVKSVVTQKPKREVSYFIESENKTIKVDEAKQIERDAELAKELHVQLNRPRR